MPEFVPQIIMIVALFAIMYFMLIRPQKKKDDEVRKMRDSLKVGDEILTIGGIYGKIVRIKDDIIFNLSFDLNILCIITKARTEYKSNIRFKRSLCPDSVFACN